MIMPIRIRPQFEVRLFSKPIQSNNSVVMKKKIVTKIFLFVQNYISDKRFRHYAVIKIESLRLLLIIRCKMIEK